jgi:hypothetical protein
LAPPPAVHSVSTPSPTTSPTTGASTGSQSRGGLIRHRASVRMPAAPLTFLEDRLDAAQVSVARKRLLHWAPHGSVPTAGPLKRGEPPGVSSSPLSCRTPSPVADTKTTLQCRGAVMTKTNPTRCSSRLPRWQHLHSTTARATGPHRRRHVAPPPSASWCGYRCYSAWRSGVSFAAPCEQRASSPPRPCFG